MPRAAVKAGEHFRVELAVHERIAGGNPMTVYIVARTPQNVWYSFVYGNKGFSLVPGVSPAGVVSEIPELRLTLLDMMLPANIARGDYWFAGAVLPGGAAVTLDNWRGVCLHRDEETVTIQ